MVAFVNFVVVCIVLAVLAFVVVATRPLWNRSIEVIQHADEAFERERLAETTSEAERLAAEEELHQLLGETPRPPKDHES